MKTLQTTSIRLKTLLLVFLVVIFLGACGDSKDEKKQATIGIINVTDALTPIIDGFKAGMEEQGYVEGENITYIYAGPILNLPALEAAVQNLVNAHVDVIFSLSTPATMSAKRITAKSGTPVIFSAVTDPLGSGIVENLAHPEANITGIKTGGSESKQLEWLQTFAPDIQRVFAPYHPDDTGSINALNVVRETAETLGIEIVAVQTVNPRGVLDAVQNMPEDIDGIFILPDSTVAARVAEIATLAIERKIPLAGISKDHAEAGTLLAFGFEHFEVGRQATRLAQQVLNGIAPENLPVETAEFYLAINLQTADALGITVSDTNLRAAQAIIR